MEPHQLVLAVAPPDDGRDHRPANLILRFTKHILRNEFADLLNKPNHFSCFSIVCYDLGQTIKNQLKLFGLLLSYAAF